MYLWNTAFSTSSRLFLHAYFVSLIFFLAFSCLKHLKKIKYNSLSQLVLQETDSLSGAPEIKKNVSVFLFPTIDGFLFAFDTLIYFNNKLHFQNLFFSLKFIS